jgi:predicted metalloprotease with PDZ domain
VKTNLNHKLARLLAALCVTTGSLAAQEPEPANAPQANPMAERVAQDLDIMLSRAALADEIIQLADVGVMKHANGLGIDVALPDAALRAQLQLPEGQGLTVTQVPEGSIGAKAGLKVHDIIVQVGEGEVNDPAGLAKRLDAADGQKIKLKLWREGRPTELEATPKKPELATVRLWDSLISNRASNELASHERYRIGVTLSEADDTLRQQLRLATGEGLVVTDVMPDSAAAKAGVQTHDVITVLDGKRLTTVEAINAQIQELKDKKFELRLLRSGKELTINLAAQMTNEAAFTNQGLVYWDTKSCRSCHGDAAHSELAWKLGADHSAWTNGHHARLFLGARFASPHAGDTTSAAPQQQVEALKSQLAEMQKTLAALEATLAAPSKPDQPHEKKN